MPRQAGLSAGTAASFASAKQPTTAAPVATDADEATAPSATAETPGGKCSLVGTWAGMYPPGPYPFSNTPVELAFNADGSGASKSARTGTAGIEYEWALEGEHFSFHGVKPVSPGDRYTCMKEQVGKYTLTFAPDCSSLTAKVESDPCKGRAMQMNGTTIKKK